MVHQECVGHRLPTDVPPCLLVLSKEVINVVWGVEAHAVRKGRAGSFWFENQLSLRSGLQPTKHEEIWHVASGVVNTGNVCVADISWKCDLSTPMDVLCKLPV